MIKYPTFIDSMDYPEPFYNMEYKYCKDYSNLFQDHSKITRTSIESLPDESLCFLFYYVESPFFECNGGDPAEISYFIVQEEMEKRNLFEDGYIIDAWRPKIISKKEK